MLALHDPWAHPDALRDRGVLLAMSGGVDSSAAAVWLLQRGARVVGLTMKNFCWSDAGSGPTSCCSVSHLNDARRVCDALGIEHLLADTSALFGPRVIDAFVSEYEHGRTPNPCVECNQHVRFPELVRRARALGLELVATGHYARIGHTADGRAFVRRGADASKDQSYFLHGVGTAARAHTVFPLGDLDKPAARALARGAGLPVADKPESQEICFLPDGDRAGFLAARTVRRPGRIVDLDGRLVGQHDGIGAFTVGQRRGLGTGGGGAPLYVHHIEPDTATVVVGDADSILAHEIELDQFWLDAEVDDLVVQVRHRHPPVVVEALVRDADRARVRLRLARAERGVAPGQAAVLYAGDAVVGGGRISRRGEAAPGGGAGCG
jgi:tRNA-specific 2-thiouridylase